MASSVEEIKKEIKKLEKAIDENNFEEALKVLTGLLKCKVSVEIIKETRIGKTVGKLRKHEKSEIAKLSSSLVEQWKQVVQPSGDKKANSPENGDNKKRKQEDESAKVKKEESKRNKREEDDVPKQKPKRTYNSSVSSSQQQEFREKTTSILEQSLGETKAEDMVTVQDAAKSIEEEMFGLWPDCGKDYKAKVRSLSFNLKKNPELRDSVMNGAVSAHKLCSMSSQEMASEELKKERERISAFHLEAAKAKLGNQTTTDMFKCGKCGKRETTYYQLQTRSADEPMTTFHTCTNCGRRWKS